MNGDTIVIHLLLQYETFLKRNMSFREIAQFLFMVNVCYQKCSNIYVHTDFLESLVMLIALVICIIQAYKALLN